MSQLADLAKPFNKRHIRPPAQGKYGDYVPHPVVVEAMLYAIGPHDFEVVELIRGYAEEVRGENRTYEARDDAVVGCLARLTADIDGRATTIQEPGDVEKPAMNNDGRNAKDAASDAYKRCAMRMGKGLHLWSGDDYALYQALQDREATDEG